jgi:hypothetical protein
VASIEHDLLPSNSLGFTLFNSPPPQIVGYEMNDELFEDEAAATHNRADETIEALTPCPEKADLEVGETSTSVQDDEKKDENLVDFGDDSDKTNPLNVSGYST